MTRRPDADEQRFLAAYDAAQFPHPSVAVDLALVTVADGSLQALLQRRDQHPFQDQHALPGTFVGMEESLDDAARRALQEKAGLDEVYLEQLYTFGSPDRDPRTRVITVAYYALVPATRLQASSVELPLRRLDVPWAGETGGPVCPVDDDGAVLPLAFDHADILGMVVKRLRGKLDYAAIGFELLPETFPLRDLQIVHETILGHRLNKDSFRRRMLSSGRIQPTGRLEESVGHRPAELYRFQRD